MPVQSVTAAQVLSPDPGPPASLWRWLARLPDPRDPRGVRFTLACVIAVAIAARLAGCDSFTAIGEWAASRPQRVLKALGCPLHRRAGVYVAPSEKTVRRVSGLAGHDLADDLLCGWTAGLAAACEVLSPAQLQEPSQQVLVKPGLGRDGGVGLIMVSGQGVSQVTHSYRAAGVVAAPDGGAVSDRDR